jgi:hypothetical protein
MLQEYILILGITAHWIDKEFNLHEALLSLQELRESHDGEHIGAAIYNALDEFNITDKLFCVTSDSAANNGTGLKCLQRVLLQNKGID